jgi:hypothetical protein
MLMGTGVFIQKHLFYLADHLVKGKLISRVEELAACSAILYFELMLYVSK